MNARQYAEHRKAKGLRGATHAAVSYAIRDGRLPTSAKRVGARGWEINAELADQEWSLNAHREERIAMGPKAPASLADATVPEPRSTRAPAVGPGNVPNIVHSEATKRRAEANLKVLDLEERMGALLEAKRIKPLIFARHRQFRDAVQGIPSRVVDAIAATIGDLDTDKRHAIRALVTTECRRVLEDLAKNPIQFNNDAVR